MLRRLLVLAILPAALTGNAHAWGPRGHQIVANLAYAQLSQKARADVDRLLALEAGATLASISTWADDVRDDSTARWHFVNFPRGSCRYDARRDCPDGQCVVAAIDTQLAILASNTSDQARLTALKYVVHLVADVHQPLHAGYYDDRGGNRYQVQAFGNGTNLHALWDSGLLNSTGLSTADLTSQVLAIPVAVDDPAASHAAQASCRIVQSPGFYPGHTVGPQYTQRFTPVMLRQLAVAGARLAKSLNRLTR
jgi:hypothetical protein